jgi:hypothetical protein
MIFTRGWIICHNVSTLYGGEIACVPKAVNDVGWIASGDLTDMEAVSR